MDGWMDERMEVRGKGDAMPVGNRRVKVVIL